jgi:PAS domain S-box-containing protein
MASGLAALGERYRLHGVALPICLIGVAVTAWYAGAGPAAVAVLLSITFFDYYFLEPRYSLTLSPLDIPYLIVVIAFASLVAWFGAVRRRVEAELRQARDHLQIEVAERTQQANLLNLTHDTIFVRDINDVITYWNRGAQELYGFTPEQAIGKRSHDLLRTVFPAPIDDQLRDRAGFTRELLRTGRWEGELRHTKADGTEVIVSSRWSLQRDNHEQPIAILETNNDITERTRREEEVQSLNRQLAGRSAELEATNKELEAFAYSVSHDLRAPLRHMSGYAELLQKRASSALDDKGRRYVTMILDAAKRMGCLIDDLLAFSRIGRAETQQTLVNLEQLVKEALSEVKPEAGGRDIVWKVQPLPSCYADRSMLRLVLINLLSNAIKFTRLRPQAEIEIGCADGNGDEIVVFVRDNGTGFDMKYANKLFGVFQRLHQSEAFEGTGIGLATVQRIVHRLGGTVRAEGAVDQGATFYFSVPKL